MSDLDNLIEAVDGGCMTAFDCGAYGGFLATYCNGHTVFLTTLLDAYHGSLDAAKALHEALLPGWWWSTFSNGQAVVSEDTQEQFHSRSSPPARAWLLAILKAYRSMQNDPS